MSSLALALLATGLTGGPHDGAVVTPPAPPGRYIRLVEEEGGDVLRLQLCVRRLAREGGPAIELAGAVHVADPSFYRTLQERLDGLDLVLFESVKPPGTGRPEHDLAPPDDAMRVRITEGRLRFLATAVVKYREEVGRLPRDLEALEEELPTDLADLVRHVREDAWGHPIALVAGPARLGRGFDLQSLGADGLLGGAGVDADLSFSDQPRLTAAERGEDGGLQADLADALGLVFQLDAMSHAAEHWRNSDLSIDQVEARLAGAGASADEVFGSLSGESILAKAAGFALKLLSYFSYGNAALKLMGLELLANADDLLANAPPELADLLEVLLVERNLAVMGDLREVLAEEPDLGTVGILYGAAHMADLEQRITTELGYRVAGEEWIDAVTVDLDELGIEKSEARFLRRTIQRTLRDQLGW